MKFKFGQAREGGPSSRLTSYHRPPTVVSLSATATATPPPAGSSGGIDLTALRAAALKSKKLKQQALEAAAAAAQAQVQEQEDVEMEEGEIGEEEGSARVESPPPLPPTYLPPPPPPPQQLFYPPPPPLETTFRVPPAPHIHAIREEAKDIINELLSYGVSPEYLVGTGISKEIVAIAFHELGFRLPSHLAHLAPAPPPHYIHPIEIYPVQSRQNSGSAESGGHPGSPPPSGTHTPTPGPHDHDRERSRSPSPLTPNAAGNNSLLAAIESRTRKQLLERKAALASRNAEQAQLLQDELERTLFASFAAAPLPSGVAKAESLEDYEEDEEDLPSAAERDAVAKANDDASAASVGHLRAAVESTEQVVYPPSGGPFAARSHASSQTPTPIPTPRARPVAADFVDSIGGHDDAQLVIDLSDSDSESGGDDDGDVALPLLAPARTAKLVVPTAKSGPSTPVPSPPLEPRRLPVPVPAGLAAPSRRNSASLDGEHGAKKRLEEKEDEIKKIMERIQRMEERKRKGATPLHQPLSRASSFAPEAGSASPSTPHSPVASSSRLPSPVHETKQIEEAMERVESLVKERQVILEEQEADAEAEVVDSEMQDDEAATKDNENGKRLCKCDTEGGTCSDKACKSNHVSGYRIDEADIAAYVIATSGLGAGEKREVFARGLTLALDRLRTMPADRTHDEAEERKPKKVTENVDSLQRLQNVYHRGARRSRKGARLGRPSTTLQLVACIPRSQWLHPFRRKRGKCDGLKPICTSCAATGTPCEYDLGGDKRKPYTKSVVSAMQARIESLEAEVERLSPMGDFKARLLRLAFEFCFSQFNIVSEREFYADLQMYPYERTSFYSPFLLNLVLATGCRYLDPAEDYPKEIDGLWGDSDTIPPPVVPDLDFEAPMYRSSAFHWSSKLILLGARVMTSVYALKPGISLRARQAAVPELHLALESWYHELPRFFRRVAKDAPNISTDKCLAAASSIVRLVKLQRNAHGLRFTTPSFQHAAFCAGTTLLDQWEPSTEHAAADLSWAPQAFGADSSYTGAFPYIFPSWELDPSGQLDFLGGLLNPMPPEEHY
ncbi:hypothetical protein RQP46_000457 [Phenoliferia psychrophenolica]